MPKISLTIKNAGKTIDGPLENRPLRISPTGIACAVYRGKVYPIYEDQSIDVTDTPWEKEECEVAKPGVRPLTRPL